VNKVFSFSAGIGEFPLHRRDFERGRGPQAKPLQQNQLMLSRLADAALFDDRAAASWQDNVYQGELG
jgi:hypothetical protein